MNLFPVTIFVFSILRFSGFTEQNVKKIIMKYFAEQNCIKCFTIPFPMLSGVVRWCEGAG